MQFENNLLSSTNKFIVCHLAAGPSCGHSSAVRAYDMDRFRLWLAVLFILEHARAQGDLRELVERLEVQVNQSAARVRIFSKF